MFYTRIWLHQIFRQILKFKKQFFRKKNWWKKGKELVEKKLVENNLVEKRPGAKNGLAKQSSIFYIAIIL